MRALKNTKTEFVQNFLFVLVRLGLTHMLLLLWYYKYVLVLHLLLLLIIYSVRYVLVCRTLYCIVLYAIFTSIIICCTVRDDSNFSDKILVVVFVPYCIDFDCEQNCRTSKE